MNVKEIENHKHKIDDLVNKVLYYNDKYDNPPCNKYLTDLIRLQNKINKVLIKELKNNNTIDNLNDYRQQQITKIMNPTLHKSKSLILDDKFAIEPLFTKNRSNSLIINKNITQ